MARARQACRETRLSRDTRLVSVVLMPPLQHLSMLADHPLAAPRWGDLVRTRGVLAVLVVELLIAAMVVYGLWALRRQTLNGELGMLASLSAAMAAQADGTLDVADATLRATRA